MGERPKGRLEVLMARCGESRSTFPDLPNSTKACWVWAANKQEPGLTHLWASVWHLVPKPPSLQSVVMSGLLMNVLHPTLTSQMCKPNCDAPRIPKLTCYPSCNRTNCLQEPGAKLDFQQLQVFFAPPSLLSPFVLPSKYLICNEVYWSILK